MIAYTIGPYRIEPYLRRWSNDRLWLQADIQSPKIEVSFTPESGPRSGGSLESAFDPKET